MKTLFALILILLMEFSPACAETAKTFLNTQIITADGKSLGTLSKDVQIGLLSEEKSWAASSRHTNGGTTVFATSSVSPAFYSKEVVDGQWSLTRPDTSDFADWRQR